MSLVESIANVAVGFGVATAANVAVLPWFGFAPSLGDAAAIGVVMTAISMARSYALRRCFEALRVRGARPESDEPYGDVPLLPGARR